MSNIDKSSNILVTGADGFIGSHLVEELANSNYNITALTYYNSFNSWGWLDSFPEEIISKIKVVSGDIRDRDFIEEQVSNSSNIFHLAALIGIPYSYHASQSYIDTNISGTLNILNACKKYNVKRILTTSTSEVYGTAKYTPIDEIHPLQGQSPYSASKIGADKIAESYFRSFNLPITIVRPFNTYGPRQSARAIIPTIITQILSGNKEIKLGNLDPIRDFIYVKDTIEGFIKIFNNEETIGQEINIASGESVSIRELLDLIVDIMKVKIEIKEEKSRIRPDSSEVDKLIGNNKKIKDLVGWTSKYNLRDGLTETIEWLKEPKNLAKYKTSIYNI